jgi:hypothetical protein
MIKPPIETNCKAGACKINDLHANKGSIWHLAIGQELPHLALLSPAPVAMRTPYGLARRPAM